MLMHPAQSQEQRLGDDARIPKFTTGSRLGPVCPPFAVARTEASTSSTLGPAKRRMLVCPEVEPIAAPSTDGGVRLIGFAMARHVDRIVQPDHQCLRRRVGKKNRSEIQIAHARPIEGSRDRAAPGNLLCRLVLVLAALHGSNCDCA